MSVMLYKAGGPHKLHDLMCHYQTVDEDQVDEQLADGWFMSPTEAHADDEPVDKEPEDTTELDPAVIPEDWQDLKWMQQAKLAVSLIGEPLPTIEGETKAVTAKNTIERVIAERAAANGGA